MKIFILNIPNKFKPSKQKFKYPRHNFDYGVEQDFLQFLLNNKHLVTNNPIDADWHYLPVFWTRYFIEKDFQSTSSLELETVKDYILDDNKTFTVCQYDDDCIVNLGNTKLFLSSNKSRTGFDIPLLSKDHPIPFFKKEKKIKASFAGRIRTHPIRAELDFLKSEKGFEILDTDGLSKFKYRNLILSSMVSICPRGYGLSSFRFYESMQLGSVPLLFSDIDNRPFQNFIEWDLFSIYASSAADLKLKIKDYSDQDLIYMGHMAKEYYNSYLSFQKWPILLIKQLRNI
jgi:hypothetical protein